MIGGGDESVNDTLETTSGETVTLTCSLEQLDDGDGNPITFTWARQDGRPLPDGSSQNDGEGERRGRERGNWAILPSSTHPSGSLQDATSPNASTV